MAKTSRSLVDEWDYLDRANRQATLNKRINEKGNYENFITGGSKALNNQARLVDTNIHANALQSPEYYHDEWESGLNPRYANPKHEDNKAYHRYTPSTKRGRRASDIYWHSLKNKTASSPEELFAIQELVNKYEKR